MLADKYMTTAQVARKFGVTTQCVRQWGDSGVLKADPVGDEEGGKFYLFAIVDVNAFEKERAKKKKANRQQACNA